ncbi:MAG: Excinuclease ABC C subunit domain protein [Candidatus Uhrbacteria bacterium GW2011_GWE2_45_35]|uniref:Excinuclease ABC C subunit domain protein n=2 Tax=Candidatus Uhriibacteriota TaxID=1752732 RepID=A0A0G1JKJ4_9BACT|nr:MAG: Excinuclease ABC C subunit domain protein [Candidatus Uhrbacteria bacterium GW2011_GWF2_44_350]KKU08770.1 MAG: Excinuclease ABC C subunit domain protein [Candidatus Uhrbacteria bacterium GW2011_GWE2_45_35]HBR80314.1 hypothetical protein [Candidatus Uhrbacteria bacterium]HCU31836.1 hypothetical protein [Candidatus Uhrbacteria bacterium]
MDKNFYIYILTNPRHTVLYVGVINNLDRRIFEHKDKINKKSFTSKYNCSKLVYFENVEVVISAIEREKEIKKWRREKKIFLINSFNPELARFV